MVENRVTRKFSKSEKARLEDSFLAELKLFQLPTPERQFKFHPTRKWAADFCWPQFKIIVELQGGTFMGGGHNRGAQIAKDHEKLNEATRMGFSCFQFSAPTLRIPKRSSHCSPALAFMYGILKPLADQITPTEKENADTRPVAERVANLRIHRARKANV
jgi:very-short-patch-repair endonuclease